MGYFPLFINLNEKKVLVIGGGVVAEHKVRILLNFAANITLVSPKATQNIINLKDSDKIILVPRKYQSSDIDNALLIVAATGDRQTNRKVYYDAIEKGIPVNVVDDPLLCTFLFPAVVNRGDFVVGVTTSGSYPALAKWSRERIEDIFPEKYVNITDILKKYRKLIFSEIQNPALRKELISELLKEAIEIGDRADQIKPDTLIHHLANTYEKIVGIKPAFHNEFDE
jgi:precorrin-2 dehydrogenase/sirohydrochlorin ferrochelatase